MKYNIFNSTTSDAPSLLGLARRVSLFLLVMSVSLLAALTFRSLVGDQFKALVPMNLMWVMFLVVAVPMAFSMVLFELPRGADWLPFRLGIATVCRTGLPLLFVLVICVFGKTMVADSAFGFLAFFYLIGFLTSCWISVHRFSNSSATRVSSDIEVDRAAI